MEEGLRNGGWRDGGGMEGWMEDGWRMDGCHQGGGNQQQKPHVGAQETWPPSQPYCSLCSPGSRCPRVPCPPQPCPCCPRLGVTLPGPIPCPFPGTQCDLGGTAPKIIRDSLQTPAPSPSSSAWADIGVVKLFLALSPNYC